MNRDPNFSILRLVEADRASLAAHFLALDREDRRLRFGAALGDEAVDEYVQRIDFVRDCVFAAHGEDGSILAAVHVARSGACAELGLSVLAGWRGKGLGNALLMRAVTWLRNRGILGVYIHCVAENKAMLHLARRHGMRLAYSGVESDGRLELAPATAASRLREWLADQRAVRWQALRAAARPA